VAQREELRLDVKVEGEQDVKKLSSDIEDLFSKVDKLAGRPRELILTSKFGQIEGEIADLVIKLDQLDAADPEVEVTIARLNELQGDLDQVIGKIREVDGTKAVVQVTADTSQAEGSMARARGEIDKIPRSAGGANSALANMYGNVAGEAGAVFGAIGPVNVAIGQMAEYAADARFEGEKLGSALGSMAKIVGPVALLSGALALVQKYMGEAGAEAAAQEERVKAFADALEEVGASGDVATTALQNLAKAVPAESASTMEKVGEAARLLGEDLVGLLTLQEGQANFDSINEGIAAFTEMGESMVTLNPLITGSKESLDAYIASLEFLPGAEGRSAAAGALLTQLWQANADATEAAANNAEFFRREAFDINQALKEQADTLALQDQLWNAVVQDLQDGKLETDNAIDAYNQLQQMLGLTNEAMDELAAKKVTEFADSRVIKQVNQLADDLSAFPAKALPASDAVKQVGVEIATLGEKSVKAGEDTVGVVDGLVDMVKAAIDAREAVQDLSRDVDGATADMNTAASRADAFSAALERIETPSALTQGLEVAGFVDDLNALGDAVREVDFDEVNILPPGDDWQAWLNMPDEAQGVLSALSTFRDDIDSEMSQAFAAGGEPAVREWAANTRQAVVDELHAAGVESDTVVQQILHALGLLDTDVTATVNIAVDEQKLQVLQDIASGRAFASQDRKLAFDIAIANQDPATALRILNQDISEVEGKEIVFTVNADTGQLQTELSNIAPPPPVPITGDTSAIPGQVTGAIAAAGTPLVPIAVDASTVPEAVTGAVAAVGTPLVPVGTDTDTTEAANALLDETSQIRRADIVARALTSRASTELDDLADPRAATVTAVSAGVAAVETVLDNLARNRQADILPVVHPQSADNSLTLLARDRIADIFAMLHGDAWAESVLNNVARDRTADIFVTTHNTTVATPTGGGGGGGAGAGTLAAPMAAPMSLGVDEPGIEPLAAPVPLAVSSPSLVAVGAAGTTVTNNMSVTVQAAVIGNRHEVERAVAKALRGYTRLNGSRN
jgi:hypothetical protein